MKKTIVLSQAIHQKGMELIEKDYNVRVPSELSQEAFDKAALEADAIVLRTNVHVSGEVIRNAPNLKIISRTGAGVDNIDHEACAEKGVLICNLPAANNISVAEHAVSMLLTLAKCLPLMDKSVRSKDGWLVRNKNYPVEVNGKTLGVLGLGAIGSITARICQEGLRMKILAYDPFADKANFPDYEITEDLDEIFTRSEFITLHIPSLPSTKGLVNSRLLSLMKPKAILINCARGGVVDYDALYEALRDKKISAAGLDVFPHEPPAIDDKLLSLPNVIVSPHSAALTKEASIRMHTDACRQIISFFETGKPLWVYDRA